MSGAQRIGINVPSDMDKNRILSVKELSSLTGISDQTLREWIKKGVLIKTKIGPKMVGIRWKHFLEVFRDELQAS